jgi:hypothetical protein
MLRFKQFISEANLSGGAKAESHAKKYIEPFIGQENTHELDKPFQNISAGSRLTVHGHHYIDGKPHAKVSSEGSKDIFSIPFSKIKKPKIKAKYNDEHAFKHIWNHGIKSGNFDINHLRDEVEKAKTDTTHPLHIGNIDEKGFSGGKRTDAHTNSYYDELHHAANTVSEVAKHPHFQDEIKKGTTAEIGGAAKLKRTKEGLRSWWEKHWGRYGGKDTTSKSDVVIGNKKVSYKKGGGSQLMSGQPDEFAATYYSASRNAVKSGHMTKEQRDLMKDKIKKVHGLLHNLKGADLETAEGLRKEAQQHINDIHRDNPNLLHHIYKEAASGSGKFGQDSDHSANYLISSSHGNKPVSIKNIETDNIAELYNNKIPRVAKPKGANRPGNVKIDLK